MKKKKKTFEEDLQWQIQLYSNKLLLILQLKNLWKRNCSCESNMWHCMKYQATCGIAWGLKQLVAFHEASSLLSSSWKKTRQFWHYKVAFAVAKLLSILKLQKLNLYVECIFAAANICFAAKQNKKVVCSICVCVRVRVRVCVFVKCKQSIQARNRELKPSVVFFLCCFY